MLDDRNDFGRCTVVRLICDITTPIKNTMECDAVRARLSMDSVEVKTSNFCPSVSPCSGIGTGGTHHEVIYMLGVYPRIT